MSKITATFVLTSICVTIHAAPICSLLGLRGNEIAVPAEKEVIPLPDGFVAVEYLQSSGTQFINLKTQPSTDMIVYISCMPKGTSYGSRGFWGWIGGGGTKRCGLASGGGGNFYRNTGSVGVNILNNYSQSLWYDITMFPTTFEIAYNGTVITGAYSEFVVSYFNTMYLFSLGGSTSNALASRIRAFKLYKSGELFYDMIPVMDADGIGCMYDFVTETAFYNTGTGAFTVGPTK